MKFRLAPATSEAEFRVADKAVQERLAYQHPGLVRRTTARNDQGSWVVIDVWRSAEDCDAYVGRGNAEPVLGAFMALVDPNTVVRERYETLD
jgi:hypothetical protein